MADLEYIGRYPEGDFGLMTKASVDARFAEVSVNQQNVDDAVIPRTAELVLPSYVQQQDALLARRTYVNQQDALRELRTARGAANGIAALGADGKIPADQVPALRDNAVDIYTAQPATNANWAAFGSQSRTVVLMSIIDPGFPYLLMPFVHVAAKSEGNWSTPGVEVVRSQSNTIIAQGYGTESQSWNWIKALPTGNGPVSYTGSSSLSVVLSRASGDAFVKFDPAGFSFYVAVYPTI